MSRQQRLPLTQTPSETRRENLNDFLRRVMLDVADKSAEPTAQAIRAGVEPVTALCDFLVETGSPELADVVRRVIEKGE